jgi:rfaE bifunctional protein nucleotidyltransferase chain/domain
MDAMRDPAGKLLSHDQVGEWITAARTEGRKLGFSCGSFDLMHPGHAQYLYLARQRCDRLLVAVNSDASVRRYKSPLRPINPERERMYMVAALESVDAVTLLEDDRPLSLLLRWKPDLYIKGGDYLASSLQSAKAVEEYGGSVEVISSDFSTSTSAMIERIAAIAAHRAEVRWECVRPKGLALLDRDGTLIRDVSYLNDPEQVELLPEVGQGLQELQAAGFALAIVTNQQGIGLGYTTRQEMIAVNQRLFHALAPFKVLISRVYYCPHTAAERCDCRKPGTAMLRRAMEDFGVPAERTVMIGDTPADLEAGTAIGCPTIIVGTGRTGFLAAVRQAVAAATAF